ncbi:MAG TPA: hypothetical protein VII33_07165 [Nakamurella sp.]
MVCDPVDAYVTVQVAAPPLRVTTPEVPHVAIGVPPSLKLTVPVGVSEPTLGVTVAVYVTACPATDGFSELVIVVVVGMTIVTMTGALAALTAVQLRNTAVTTYVYVPSATPLSTQLSGVAGCRPPGALLQAGDGVAPR